MEKMIYLFVLMGERVDCKVLVGLRQHGVMQPIDQAVNYSRDSALGMTQLPLEGNSIFFRDTWRSLKQVRLIWGGQWLRAVAFCTSSSTMAQGKVAIKSCIPFWPKIMDQTPSHPTQDPSPPRPQC